MAENKLEKPLTEAQQIEGQRLLRETMRQWLPGCAVRIGQVFAPDNPAKVYPSEKVMGKIAYTPEGKETRVCTSLGRYLVKQCGFDDDAYLKRAVGYAIASVTELYPCDQQFEIVTGAAVMKAYRDGVGARSCMTGQDASGRDNPRIKEIDYYVGNPEKVGLLIWRKTAGRALLWNLDDGRRWLDRIYAGNMDGAIKAYSAYCKQNDILPGHSIAGRLAEGEGVVTMKNTAVKPPYFDSWQIDQKRGRLLQNCPACKTCGHQCPSAELVEAMCPTCVEMYCECACGRMMRKDSGYKTVDGTHVCERCAGSMYACSVCGIYGKERQIKPVGHIRACKGCAGKLAALRF